MLAFPSMIYEAAVDAGMKVPPGDMPNIDEFDIDANKEEYPHWFVYCILQLCRPITWGNHWENAKIIAKIPVEKLKTMCEEDFNKLGFSP